MKPAARSRPAAASGTAPIQASDAGADASDAGVDKAAAAKDDAAKDDAAKIQASKFAARAPLPPVRPDDLEQMASVVASASPQQAEPVVSPEAKPELAPQQVAVAPAAEVAPPAGSASGSGFNLFKFLSGKSQGQESEQQQVDAEVEPRRGRRHGRGEARDASARAIIAPLIERHARANGIPVSLADAVIRVESRYNASARNGSYMGLTQIHVSTARSMGYTGGAQGLLDADTNLRYGMKYLATAYRLAGGDTCRTIMKYQGGHRTERMSAHAARYCSRVRVMMAAK